MRGVKSRLVVGLAACALAPSAWAQSSPESTRLGVNVGPYYDGPGTTPLDPTDFLDGVLPGGIHGPFNSARIDVRDPCITVAGSDAQRAYEDLVRAAQA